MLAEARPRSIWWYVSLSDAERPAAPYGRGAILSLARMKTKHKLPEVEQMPRWEEMKSWLVPDEAGGAMGKPALWQR